MVLGKFFSNVKTKGGFTLACKPTGPEKNQPLQQRRTQQPKVGHRQQLASQQIGFRHWTTADESQQ